MTEVVKRVSSRFHITQDDYVCLKKNVKASLMIVTTPLTNQHPKGHYIIPNKKARKYIESRQGNHNWRKHKNHIQDSIPFGLEEYFTYL